MCVEVVAAKTQKRDGFCMIANRKGYFTHHSRFALKNRLTCVIHVFFVIGNVVSACRGYISLSFVRSATLALNLKSGSRVSLLNCSIVTIRSYCNQNYTGRVTKHKCLLKSTYSQRQYCKYSHPSGGAHKINKNNVSKNGKLKNGTPLFEYRPCKLLSSQNVQEQLPAQCKCIAYCFEQCFLCQICNTIICILSAFCCIDQLLTLKQPPAKAPTAIQR